MAAAVRLAVKDPRSVEMLTFLRAKLGALALAVHFPVATEKGPDVHIGDIRCTTTVPALLS